MHLAGGKYFTNSHYAKDRISVLIVIFIFFLIRVNCLKTSKITIMIMIKSPYAEFVIRSGSFVKNKHFIEASLRFTI